MTDNQDKNIIIVLEIGTSALRAAAAEVLDDTANIIDIETEPLEQSVRYGRIQNIEDVAGAARRCLEALSALPALASRPVQGVYVAMGGRSLAASHAEASLTLPAEAEVTQGILDRLAGDACAGIADDREILDVLPLEYIVDGIDTTRPCGSVASSISAGYTVVYCNSRNVRTTNTVVCERLGLDIAAMVTRPLAEAAMALTPAERKAGCMLVDLGAETTTVSIYKDDALRYLATIPMGSDAITADIAAGMSLAAAQAREVKEDYADIAASKGGDERLDKINTLARERAMHIIANIKAQPEFAGYKGTDLAKGVVLTGGGSLMRHFGTRLGELLMMPVRTATASAEVSVTDSSMATGAFFPVVAVVAEAARLARLPQATPCLGPAPVQERNEEAANATDTADAAGTMAVDAAAVSTGFAVDDEAAFNNYGIGAEVKPGTRRADDDDILADDDKKRKHSKKHQEPEEYEEPEGSEEPEGTKGPGRPGRSGGFSSVFERLSNRFTNLMKGPDGSDGFDDEQ